MLVMAGGEVSQQILTLAEPVSQERLSQTASRLNQLLTGQTVDSITSLPARADALEQDILSLISQDMRRSAESISGEIYPDGGQQILKPAGEGEWEELRQCSIVLARYGVPGLATGTLGVLGPMRMSYARAIPTVRYVAGLLSDLVNDTITGE